MMWHRKVGRTHLTIWQGTQRWGVPVYGLSREPDEILGLSWGHGGASLWRR